MLAILEPVYGLIRNSRYSYPPVCSIEVCLLAKIDHKCYFTVEILLRRLLGIFITRRHIGPNRALCLVTCFYN